VGVSVSTEHVLSGTRPSLEAIPEGVPNQVSRRLSPSLSASVLTLLQIITLMQQCWNGEPDVRPEFPYIVSVFESLKVRLDAFTDICVFLFLFLTLTRVPFRIPLLHSCYTDCNSLLMTRRRREVRRIRLSPSRPWAVPPSDGRANVERGDNIRDSPSVSCRLLPVS
jgi:hypothetical protein